MCELYGLLASSTFSAATRLPPLRHSQTLVVWIDQALDRTELLDLLPLRHLQVLADEADVCGYE
jgi:hypothetical protein